MRGLLAIVAIVSVLAAGCGDGDDDERPDLLVSAAASLKQAFTAYGDAFTPARARFSFAGSDDLAAQIRTGARPDVFAAANAKLPDALFREGLVERPVAFARNRLAVAVPADGPRVRTLADLGRGGVTIAVGAAAVPIGSYTRDVLGRLPAARARAILRNVRSEEPDVAGIVGKVSEGAVDAGFVYVSDIAGSQGRLRAIALPAALQPEVTYEAAVVKGTEHVDQARAFLAGLLDGRGARALRDDGFLPPP